VLPRQGSKARAEEVPRAVRTLTAIGSDFWDETKQRVVLSGCPSLARRPATAAAARRSRCIVSAAATITGSARGSAFNTSRQGAGQCHSQGKVSIEMVSSHFDRPAIDEEDGDDKELYAAVGAQPCTGSRDEAGGCHGHE